MDIGLWYAYGALVTALIITALGVAFGQAHAGQGALEAINRQPSAQTEIRKIVLIGIAIIETAAVLVVTFCVWILASVDPSTVSLPIGLARLGTAFAIGLPGLFLGLYSGRSAYYACLSVARQPFFSQQILNVLLIVSVMAQTPMIFGLILALFIETKALIAGTLVNSLQCIAAGLAIGIGSVGPAIGLTSFGGAACLSIGINKTMASTIRLFVLFSQALIETPLLFALVTALFILFKSISVSTSLSIGVILISAALCTGIGTLMPSINSSRTAQTAIKTLVHHPAQAADIQRTSLLAQAFIDTTALYPMIISLLLLLLSPS